MLSMHEGMTLHSRRNFTQILGAGALVAGSIRGQIGPPGPPARYEAKWESLRLHPLPAWFNNAKLGIKDKRDIFYGHKLCLAVGKSGLVLDVVVLDGNPADSTLAAMMVDRQERLYGRPPNQVAFDGGFASRANLEEIKGRGVADVCFR